MISSTVQSPLPTLVRHPSLDLDCLIEEKANASTSNLLRRTRSGESTKRKRVSWFLNDSISTLDTNTSSSTITQFMDDSSVLSLSASRPAWTADECDSSSASCCSPPPRPHHVVDKEPEAVYPHEITMESKYHQLEKHLTFRLAKAQLSSVPWIERVQRGGSFSRERRSSLALTALRACLEVEEPEDEHDGH